MKGQYACESRGQGTFKKAQRSGREGCVLSGIIWRPAGMHSVPASMAHAGMRAIPGTTYGLAGCYTLERSPAIAAHYLYVHDGMNFPYGTSGLANLIRMLRVQHQPSADSYSFTRVDQVFNSLNRPSGVAGPNPRADLDHHGAASVLAW